MKLIVLLILFALMPTVMAVTDVHEVAEGRITVVYPEKVTQDSVAEVAITVEMNNNPIKKLNFPLTGETANCLPLNCQTTLKVPIGKAPVTILMSVELEEGRITALPENIGEGEEFFFLEVGTENTLVFIKYFTILPEEPDEIAVLDSSPYLEDLILDLISEKTDLIISEEDFDKQKALAKENIIITKKAEFSILETEGEKKVRTKWTITLEPIEGIKKLKNVRVFEEIDKDAAQSTNDIAAASDKFIVLKDDPLIMWEFDELDAKKEITYETDAASLTGAATVVTTEDVQKVSLLQFLLPILIIPIIAGVIIYFNRKKDE